MLRTSVEGNEGQQLDLPNGKHGDHLWNSQQANSLLFTPGARFEIAGRQLRILQRRQGIWRGMVSTSSSNCETQPYLIVCRRSSFVPHPWHLFSSPLYDVSYKPYIFCEDMILAMSVSFIHCLVLKSAFPWDKYWNSFPCQEVRWKFLNVVHQFYVSWGIAGKSSISEVSRKVTSLKTLHPDMPNCQIVSWNISTRYVREGEKKREGQYTEKCIQCQQMVVSSLCLITQTTCGAV